MSESSFVDYLKKTLRSYSPEDRTSGIPFAHVLYITHLFSFSDHIKYFFEKDLIEPILQLGTAKQGFENSLVSKILLNLISNSLQSEWRTAYLHEKHILNILGCLLSNSILQDQSMSSYLMRGQNEHFLYFNKQTFINVFKGLYLLSDTQDVQASRSGTDKITLFIKNFTLDFIIDLRRGLQAFFTAKTERIVVTSLEEELTVERTGKPPQKIKLFKIIHLFIQNVIRQMGQKQKNILKQILFTKRMYYDKLYSFVSLNQLQVNSIPIEVKIFLKFQSTEKTIRLARIGWNSLKMYISGWLESILNFKVQQFRARDLDRQIEIRQEEDFKQSLNRVVSFYHGSKFVVRIQINDVRRRFQAERLQLPGMGSQSYRQNDILNRFNTVTIPGARASTPSQRANTPTMGRNLTASYNISQRQSRSPMPNNNGVLRNCRICGMLTNNSDLCRQCLGVS